MKQLRRVVAVAALALGASAGAAFGADLLLDQSPAGLVPSTAPMLLGPITESGRTGWDCAPERAATARTTAAAGLPKD